MKMVSVEQGCFAAEKVIGFEVHGGLLSVSFEGGRSTLICKYEERSLTPAHCQALCIAASRWLQEFLNSDEHIGLLNPISLAPYFNKEYSVLAPVIKSMNGWQEIQWGHSYEVCSRLLDKYLQDPAADIGEKSGRLEQECASLGKKYKKTQSQWSEYSKEWEQKHLNKGSEGNEPMARRRIGI